MSINVIFGSNVAGDSNYKRDNGNSNNLTDKTSNRRNNTGNSGRTVEEMVQNAQKTMREKDSVMEYDAVSDVLEDVYLFKGLSLEDRLSIIETASSSTELEEILGIPSDYYRNKYFALLKVIALCSGIK